MTEPMDAILAIHNAFRRDMEIIDTAAYEAAQGKSGRETSIERCHFFNQVLSWHAHGEEMAIFPALEKVAPSVAQAYLMDHHGLDAAYEALNEAILAHDRLRVARASAAFRFHHDIHLDKEDAHLYRLIRERVPMPDQIQALGVMSSLVPQERFPEVITWMFPLLGNDDRENMTRIWQTVMPPPVFDMAKQLIQKAIGDEWTELTRRIPTLV